MYSRCASAGYDPICAGCESLPRSFACKALTRRQPRSSRLASPSATEMARQNMIDNFALFVSHGLLLLAAWRLIFRDDLDTETPPDVVRTERKRSHWRERMRRLLFNYAPSGRQTGRGAWRERGGK